MRLRYASDATRKPLTVPDHCTLKTGTLRTLVRDANLTIEQFVALFSEGLRERCHGQ